MKSKIVLILVLVQFICLVPTKSEKGYDGLEFIVHGTPTENSIRVSMIELICNPTKYNKKEVNVDGIISFGEGEGPGVLMFNTWGLKDNANIVYLTISEELERKSSIFSGEEVTVEGEFYCIEAVDGEIKDRRIDVKYVRMLKIPKNNP